MNEKNHTPLYCAAFACALLALPAFAAPPDAGSLLRDIPKPNPPTRGTTELPQIPEQSAPPAHGRNADVRIAVKAIRITGAKAIPVKELQALVAGDVGRELTFAQLDDIARRLTRHYHEAGYLLARAYLPAQEVKDGVVEIAVLEGRLDQLTVNNSSLLDPHTVAAYLDDLKTGEALTADALERRLLLISDLPGAAVRSTLRPGASIGTSDLDVSVLPQTPYGGTLELDNYGNRYTGDWRLGASAFAGNLSGFGDSLSARLLTSNGIRYGRLAWQLPVGSAGTQIGAAWSEMRYKLGTSDFSSLDAHGKASIGSLYLLQAIHRGRAANLNGQAVYERKHLSDTIGSTQTDTGRTIDLWTLGLSGDAIDGILGGGATQGSLSVASGQLGLDPASATLDRSGHHTAGTFTRLNAYIARVQQVAGKLSLFLAVRGQAADKNLDGAEKISLGGPQGVRAYPQGEAPADDAWLATLELRYAFAGNWQASLFHDNAQGRLNHDPTAADGDNIRRLAGHGIGLAWQTPDISLQLGVAWREGSRPVSDADRQPRAWLQAIKRF